MKLYELTYLISPNLSEEQLKIFQEKINFLIQQEQGILGRIINITKKRLAYPIRKNIQAYLSTLSFQLNPENLASLEKKLKAENYLLRYTIFAQKPKKIIEIFKKPLVPTQKISKPKVELKEIEKKLEEILGEYESQ